MYKKRYTT